MLTLSTYFTNAAKSGALKFTRRVDLYYNDGSACLSLAEKDFHTSDGTTYDGLIYSVGDVQGSINPKDASHSVSNCQIRLAEGQGVFTRLAFSTNNYLNRAVKVYYLADGCAAADAVKYFDGLIVDYYFDERACQWVFDCVASGTAKHKQLPGTVVNRTDHPNAPDVSLGAPLPLLYGIWEQQQGTPYYDNQNLHWKLAPTVCIDGTTGVFAVAGHAVSDIGGVYYLFSSLGTYGGSLYAYGGTGAYCSETLTAPGRITLPNTSEMLYWVIQALWIQPTVKASQNAFAGDIGALFDKDYLTSVGLTGDLLLKFPGLSGEGDFFETPNTLDVALQAHVSSYVGANTSILELFNRDANSAFNVVAQAFNSAGIKTSNSAGAGLGNATNRTTNDGNNTALAATAQWSWEELARYEWGLDVGASATAYLTTLCMVLNNIILTAATPFYQPLPAYPIVGGGWRIGNRIFGPGHKPLIWPNAVSANRREAVGRAVEQITGSSNLYVEVDGRTFGSWIDGASRVNSFDEGDVIERSAFVIESLLRDELGFVDADIDTASFDDIAETDLYKVRVCQNDFIDSRDLIKALGYSARLIVFQTTDGIWRARHVDDLPAYSHYAFDYNDVAFTSVHLSSQDWLCNDLVLNYGLDIGNQKYQHQKTASDATSQGTTVAGVNRKCSQTVDNPYLHRIGGEVGASTDYALNFANYFVAQWKDQHLVVEFECLHPRHWDVQEGDLIEFVNVPNTVTDGMFAAGTATDFWSSWVEPRSKYFLVIGCVRKADRVCYTAFQLHNLSENLMLTTADDAMINEHAANTNDGTGVIQCNKNTATTYTKRGLIRFDLTALAGKTIDSAILKLWTSGVTSSGGNIDACPCTKAWVEGEVTWNKYNASTNWTAPGGDFGTAEDTVGVTATGESYLFDVTNTIAGQLAGTNPGGILLKFTVETDALRSASFYQTETISQQYRPTLTVVYH